MKLDWQVIPHSQQRYDTVGDWDWSEDGSTLFIRISKMNDARYEFLVGLHEMIEAVLCQTAGISPPIVTAFDKASDADEPGEDPMAPYHFQHKIADAIERIIANLMLVDWGEYEAKLRSL